MALANYSLVETLDFSYLRTKKTHGYTYHMSLMPHPLTLVDLGSMLPKAVANMSFLSSTNPTCTYHVPAHTQKLIDYSAIDPTTVNVTGFHKGAFLQLSQKSLIIFYNDIFVQGLQYNKHITNPDTISVTVGTIPP